MDWSTFTFDHFLQRAGHGIEFEIFRYLLDKDVFEGFYVNSFAKRLLEQRHICEDAERALVLKLKEECGFQFT